MKKTAPIILITVSILTSLCTAEPYSFDSGEYPIGIFAAGKQHFQSIAATGIDYVQLYDHGLSTSEEAVAEYIDYFDAAESAGLKVMFTLRSNHWIMEQGKEKGIATVLELASAVKDHPAMGFWYLADEPDSPDFNPQDLQDCYKALKKLTPDIPIAVCLAWTKDWANPIFQKSLDIVMPDLYPISNIPFPKGEINVLTNFVDDAIAFGNPVMPIAQCASWEHMAAPVVTIDGVKYVKGKRLDSMRYPNQTEIRYWCYSSLSQGCYGLFWFSHYRSLQGGPNWFNKEFGPVIKEYRFFTDTIKPANKPYIFKRARDINVFMAMWDTPDGKYMVLVNGWPFERELTRWTEDKVETAKLIEWGTTRQTDAKIEDGAARGFTAQPWETFIWKIEE